VTTAFGRYQLLEARGRQLALEVFRAKSSGVEGFEKSILLKRLVPELAADPGFLESFLEKARRAMRLSHANVVQVFDLGSVETELGPSYFMAMEYVAGLDLATVLERSLERGPLPVELGMYVGAEIAKALDHAHKRRDERLRPLSIVHGGLESGSVLLSWEGEVKVSDFCVAPLLRELPPGHQSTVSVRGDLYSLGVLLHELLVGALPGPKPAALPGVDSEISELVLQLLERDAVEPASAAQVYEQLRARHYASGVPFGELELAQFLEEFHQIVPGIPPEQTLRSQPPSLPPPQPEVSGLPAKAGARPAIAEIDRSSEVAVLVVRFGEPVSEPQLRVVQQTVERYGGHCLASGDTLLRAVFGLTEPEPRQLENALRCALVLTRAPSPSAIAVESGVVDVAGIPSADAVEPLQRLTGSAAALAERIGRGVAVRGDGALALTGLFAMQPLPAAGETSPAWLVEDARTPQNAYGKLVGRKRELGLLAELVVQASKKQLQVACITGGHGIGKTRLLYEVKRRIDKNPRSIACYVAAIPPQAREHAYAGIGAMLRTLCGVREGDPEERVLAVEPRLRALGLRQDEAEIVLGELGAASSSLPAQPGQALDAAVNRMFSALASDKLHIFAWDNAQELDRGSSALLAKMAESLLRKRVVFLFAARPAKDPSLRDLPGYREIELAQLDADDALRLIAERLGVERVHDRLFEFVHARTGGHPMLIEEFLHEALSSGTIVVRNGRVEQVLLDARVSVPRSLRMLLEHRIRRLPEEERQLLAAAAMLGESADSAILAEMLDSNIGRVNALAESLEQQQLLSRAGPVSLAFSSPMLAEVLLERLEPDARFDLHRRAARAYEQRLGADSRAADRVAGHLARAGESNRAADYFAQAGLEQARTSRWERAAANLIKALEHASLELRDDAELGAWLHALGSAVQHVPSAAGLEALLGRLRDHFGTPANAGSPARRRALLELGRMLGSLHRYRDAQLLLARAADGAEPPEAQRALQLRLALAMEQGDFKVSHGLAEQLLGLPPSQDVDGHHALLDVARAYAFTGDDPSARSVLERARALPGAEDAELVCQRQATLALLASVRGDWEACRVAAEQAVEQARSAGLRYDVVSNQLLLGEAQLKGGDPAHAFAAYSAALASSEELGFERLALRCRVMLAYLEGMKGSSTALEELAQLTERAEERRWTLDEVLARYWLGKLLLHSGDASSGQRELRSALELADESANQAMVGECRRLLADQG
jgi:serine/threonine protein kinase